MSEQKVICIGSASKDIFFPTKEGIVMKTPEDVTSQKKIAFEVGAKYHINDRFEALGGCGVNQAIGLTRLGVPAMCYAVLGNDVIGQWMRQEIKKEGVDDSLIVNEECLTGLSAIIVNEISGERIIFSNQEATERLKIAKQKLEAADWISVSDLTGDWRQDMDDILAMDFMTGARIAFNPRGRNIQEDAQKVFELAGKCEVFFVNKDEAIEILAAKKFSAEQLNGEEFLLKELKKSGARIVVITDGERGAWAFDGNEIVHEESLLIKTVDTTGAGDAFASGFLAAHIKGKFLKGCVQWGIQNGASVAQYYGGVEGLLREEQMEK